MTDAARAAELAARGSYGRLLALLSSRTHDIALAEDALAEAFARALSHWPAHGIPDNPDAWLLTTARNRLTDSQRRQFRFPTVNEIPDMPSSELADGSIPDRRLSLLMVCAHPAIAQDLHVPLMLQTVLGLEAKTIARLFLISPVALSKRLVRTKAKIRDAGIPFALPCDDALRERSTAILEALYALHAHDWLDPAENLGDEAFYLADLLGRLIVDNAEALGLAALIAFSHARARARIVDDMLVPTDEQDVTLWNDALIRYGKRQLHCAYVKSSVGRFQIEAAIDAVHIARKETGSTDWLALNKLYVALLKIAPSVGSLVAQAVVTGRLHGPRAGQEALDAAETVTGSGYQPLWAARADLQARAGNHLAAAKSYDKAISLATDGPTINLLARKRALELKK
ncbi:RNA polymerase sigma-70 factor (ECF subfamily) [Labrenzia sp. EL_208]|nr:RNA polymerase sigma-70 factor (ECF subfamily) [Labrenzia sp. EL_132]MBG6228443.1 RNA polymerase sigma-70 factor (ECF subfamily) [Labrenzia sp. EL_208]